MRKHDHGSQGSSMRKHYRKQHQQKQLEMLSRDGALQQHESVGKFETKPTRKLTGDSLTTASHLSNSIGGSSEPSSENDSSTTTKQAKAHDDSIEDDEEEDDEDEEEEDDEDDEDDEDEFDEDEDDEMDESEEVDDEYDDTDAVDGECNGEGKRTLAGDDLKENSKSGLDQSSAADEDAKSAAVYLNNLSSGKKPQQQQFKQIENENKKLIVSS